MATAAAARVEPAAAAVEDRPRTETNSSRKAVLGPPFAVGGDRDMVMVVRWGRQDSIRIH